MVLVSAVSLQQIPHYFEAAMRVVWKLPCTVGDMVEEHEWVEVLERSSGNGARKETTGSFHHFSGEEGLKDKFMAKRHLRLYELAMKKR
jgi:hypothetical protein